MRIVVLIEVVLACCLCHVAYRALQQTLLGDYERAVGRSYLPGCVMLALGCIAIWWHGRGWEAFGVTGKHWRFALIVGLACMLLFVLLGGGIALLGLRSRDVAGTIAQAFGWLAGSLVILYLLQQAWASPENLGRRWAGWMGLGLLCGFLMLPLLFGLQSNQSMLTTLFAVMSLFLLVGFGEELFFRGYVQSRLNFVFGRPYRLLGMAFGAGLVITALLFGAIHVLNPVDYFQGRYDFAWGSGIVSACSGCYYGCLREKTGSILASGIAHGLAGVMTEIPRVLSA
jgi:membrane protease YdiL (CAAX protease family)